MRSGTCILANAFTRGPLRNMYNTQTSAPVANEQDKPSNFQRARAIFVGHLQIYPTREGSPHKKKSKNERNGWKETVKSDADCVQEKLGLWTRRDQFTLLPDRTLLAYGGAVGAIQQQQHTVSRGSRNYERSSHKESSCVTHR